MGSMTMGPFDDIVVTVSDDRASMCPLIVSMEHEKCFTLFTLFHIVSHCLLSFLRRH
jgi:hypothetical protein